MRIRGQHGQLVDGLITRFEQLVGRILRRISRSTAATITRGGPRHVVTVEDMTVITGQWLRHLDAEVMPALAGVYGTAAAAMAADLTSLEREVAALTAPDATEFLAEARNRLVAVGDHLWEAARDQLTEGMAAGEDMRQLAARVQAAAGVAEPRAMVIARTEVIAANNAATIAQARLVDDPTMIKEWLATPDQRTRETHHQADGQRRYIGERFQVGDAFLDFPGDPTGPPGEIIQCRCSMAFDFDDQPNPVYTAAGEFVEALHPRADDGKFAHEAGVGDKLGLAGSIRLGPGETLAGSDKVGGNFGQVSLAWVDHDGTRTLRLGALGGEESDIQKWRGDNKGATVALDEQQTVDLRTSLAKMESDGKKAAAELKQNKRKFAQVEAEHGDDPSLMSPDAAAEYEALRDRYDVLIGEQAPFSSGMVATDWGELHFGVSAEEFGSGYSLDLAVRPPDAAPDWDLHSAVYDAKGANLTKPQLAKLIHLLDGAHLGPAAGSPPPGGGPATRPGGLVPVPEPAAPTSSFTRLPRRTSMPPSATRRPVTAAAPPAATPAVPPVTPPAAAPTPQPAGDAAPEQTGAMIALVPSDADAQRLAVDGGETADQLHCTLLYLGEGAAFSDAQRQAVIDAVHSVMDDWPVVEADGFAVSLFNPGDATDREPCIVLGLSGDDIEIVHSMVDDAVVAAQQDPGGFEIPAQHSPYIPHITLAYTGDAGQVAALTDRVGPVTFDRVRVAFAGQVTDIPLAPDVADMPPDGVGTDWPGWDAYIAQAITAALASDAVLRNYWVRGKGAAKVRWNTPNDFVRCVRHLAKYVGDPKGLCAEYHHEATGMWPGDRRNNDVAGPPAGQETNMATPAAAKPPAVKAGPPAPAAPAAPMAVPCPPGWHPDDDGDCQPDPGTQGCPDGWVPDDDGDCQPAPAAPDAGPGDMPGSMPHAGGGAAPSPVVAPSPGAAPPAAPGPTPEGGCPDGQHPDPDTGDCVPDDATPAPDGQVEHFHTIVEEGVSTGLRTFTPGAITWRSPPFAFHWQFESSAHNGQPRVVQVGLVTRAQRDGNVIHFWGRLDLRSPEGLDYARRLADGFARWSSVGADESLKESDIEFVWPADEGEGAGLEALFAEPEQMIFNAYRVAEITAVSIPAQADAAVEPTPALLEALTQMGALTAAAVSSHKSATSDTPWDAAAAEKALPSPLPLDTARAEYAWIDDTAVQDGQVPKSAAKFPHHDVGGDGVPGAANLAACSAAIAAIHGGRGGATIPDTDRKGVYDHVAAHLRAGGQTPPPFQSSPIVAAGYTITIPDVAPPWWFDRPTDVTAHGALTVTDEGRIYGYLAPSGVAHRAFRDRRVTVPMGRVDYDRWMGGEALVAGGRVVAGPITMECGHLPPSASSDADVRMQHYDNACSVVAKARIGEDSHGVWIAGALEPGVTADQVSRMLACRLSGDWAPHPERPGWQEFVAALLVPVPGFPMARTTPSVRVSGGVMVASAVPVRLVHADTDVLPTADLSSALERIARSIGRDRGSRMAELHSRIYAPR